MHKPLVAVVQFSSRRVQRRSHCRGYLFRVSARLADTEADLTDTLWSPNGPGCEIALSWTQSERRE